MMIKKLDREFDFLQIKKMRRMVGSLSRLSRGVLWTRGKITDTVMARKERVELTEDELFFEQNDQDPTELLLAGLERDRKLLAEKEALGRDTPEWKLVCNFFFFSYLCDSHFRSMRRRSMP